VISFLTGTGIAVVAALVVFVLDRLEHRDYYLRDAIERARIIEHAQTPVRRAFTGISPSDMGNNKAALWRSPSLWKLIFSKLLLGVNDTQLFTGTAVQIVSLVQLCTISIYHFRVVTELAYLSTVTHLLTLVALQRFFVENRWANSVRVLVMVLNLALLGYTTWIDYALDTLGNGEDGAQVACYLVIRELPLTTLSSVRWTVLFMMAITVHFSIFWSMYRSVIPFARNLHSTNLFGGSNPSKSYLWYWIGWLSAVLLRYAVTPAYTIYGLVVGSQVLRNTQAFGSAPVTIIGAEREWGFGQVLAVFFLALVVLPGWETFFE
jgi:hypothetical protein